jgi:hypothetical protein
VKHPIVFLLRMQENKFVAKYIELVRESGEEVLKLMRSVPPLLRFNSNPVIDHSEVST